MKQYHTVPTRVRKGRVGTDNDKEEEEVNTSYDISSWKSKEKSIIRLSVILILYLSMTLSVISVDTLKELVI